MDSSAAPNGPAKDGAEAASEAPSSTTEAPDIQLDLETVDLDTATRDIEAGIANDEPSHDSELAPSDADGDAAPLLQKAANEDPERAASPPSSRFLALLAVVVAVLDIASKEWAKHALAGPGLRRSLKHIDVIPNYMSFIFAQNPGGAWSFLRGMPDGLRRPFFLFVSSGAIVFIIMVYRRLEPRQWAMRWGLPLALGGAWGNLADRIRYGWVVDFIDVYYKRGGNEMHWPTFNVADIAIVVGVGLMALDLLSLRKSPDTKVVKAEAETPTGATT